MFDTSQSVLDAGTSIRRLLEDDAFSAWPRRTDALNLLTLIEQRLKRPATIAVVGEFSSGKSYLLNALLDTLRSENGVISGVLAVDVNPSTATITELSYSAEPRALARFPSGREERVPLDRLARFVAVAKDAAGEIHSATDDDDAAPSFVEVELPSPFLQRGYVIADTPGLASVNPAHRRTTLSYLPHTDAVLYLIDTQKPFSDGDASFLRIIGEHVRAVFIVQTKIDLWRNVESDGREAWENARNRILAKARNHAPKAEIIAVSAFEYAEGFLKDNPALVERSGFPAFRAMLDRSLDMRIRSGRTAAAYERLKQILEDADRFIERERGLLASSDEDLDTQQARAIADWNERNRRFVQEQENLMHAGAQRKAWIVARGEDLRDEIVGIIERRLDVADVAHIRDRYRLHALIDATVLPIYEHFATNVADKVAEELKDASRDHPRISPLEITAAGFGGEAGSGVWSRDSALGLRSTIVLYGIGGPTGAIVDEISNKIAEHGADKYMKRELTHDLKTLFFPRLENDLVDFSTHLADQIAAIYGKLADAFERERTLFHEESVAPIERARSLKPMKRTASLNILDGVRRDARILREHLDQLNDVRALSGFTETQSFEARRHEASVEVSPEFDAETYEHALNPRRYRIVLVGALSRGKTSLINALAGTPVLSDDGATEANFPIHIRYGPFERASRLDPDGHWKEIPRESAMQQATQTPVLLEVPWKFPPELVLVHTPAFDSGRTDAESTALAAAKEAGEIVALFSRQLSDSELNVYERVAEYKHPMRFVHTIADNETPSERSSVVDLAKHYLDERHIETARIFTVSAREDMAAHDAGRAPAAWNELGALRETLSAKAEEHMRHQNDLDRAEFAQKRQMERSSSLASTRSPAGLRRAIQNLFRKW